MTDLSQTILDKYQVRKTKKQKLAFIELLKKHHPDLQVQEGGFPKSRNIIVGDVENARVVLTAHYDTCAQLPVPNFIAPKNPFLTILYSVALIIPMFLIVYLLNMALNLLSNNYWLHYWMSLALYFGLLVMMVAGPANKHTANDNTSGVIMLCELLERLSAKEEEGVVFVFFDHEETGLLGSSSFKKRYKKQMEDKLLINYDCVSDGDYIFLAVSKAARPEIEETVRFSFIPTEHKAILLEQAEKVYYPSDQAHFKRTIAVAALKHKRFLGYYMDRIHTSKDTVFDEENVKLLCDGTQKFLAELHGK